jgi:integrase
MSPKRPAANLTYLEKFTSRKVEKVSDRLVGTAPDSLAAWVERYLTLAVVGVRSEEVTKKITLHLGRFGAFYKEAYGHDRITTVLKRDVLAWQQALVAQGLAAATVNSHLASLSSFTTWVHAQAPRVFPVGDPAKGIGELGLPPLEPRTLRPDQVRSLKSVCDRLERFTQMKGRRWARRRDGDGPPVRERARPLRDRAIVYVLLSTGLRREELVTLNLDQVAPRPPEALRRARPAKITRVQGKGKTQREVFLSADARTALADYLEQERPHDAGEQTTALFLSAAGIPARSPDGRLSPRAINLILEQIGRYHDAEQTDPARRLSPLRPHDLRHTFAFHLAQVTGADAYELERRLGHRSQRYIQRYTNPPETVAARYVEEF